MTMPRSAPPPPDRRAGVPSGDLREGAPAGVGDDAADTGPDATSPPDGVDLSSLSVAGITRRRVAWVSGALVSAWIVIVFARQAGDAASASARVDQMNESNRALAAEVASLEQELHVIEKPAYIAQAARAYRIGTEHEVPFTLDSSVPSPAADAPGSAALSLGARDRKTSPLESWLSILFGPSS